MTILVCVVALGLVACGESDDSSTTSALAEQETKAQDAQAESVARTAQTAVEVYATDNNGSYEGVDVRALEGIEPTLRGPPVVAGSTASTYDIAVTSESGTVFALARKANGAVQFKCNAPGTGNCPPGGDWSK
jgi:hypothetical protein